MYYQPRRIKTSDGFEQYFIAVALFLDTETNNKEEKSLLAIRNVKGVWVSKFWNPLSRIYLCELQYN